MKHDLGHSPNLPQAAVDFLGRGEVIAAIKLVRQEQDIGLKEAKDLVDAYIRSQPTLRRQMELAQAKTRQTLGRWLTWFLILAAGAAYFLFQGR